MTKSYTLLQLIDRCDNFPFPGSPLYQPLISSIAHFRIHALPDVSLGYMPLQIAETFATTHPDSWTLSDEGTHPRTLVLTKGSDSTTRSVAVAETLQVFKSKALFCLAESWRDESFGVYGPISRSQSTSNIELLRIERSAASLLGIVKYGVHMTAFRRVSESNTVEIWVPRRSATKQTHPNMLDNSVAGGLPAGETPLNCLIRECEEEASLPEHVVKTRVKSAGTQSNFTIAGDGSGGVHGLLEPELQFIYDLDLTGMDEVVLKPSDGEVAGFEIMNLKQVREALERGEFSLNTAVIVIDFLIRHGLINETEDSYAEICTRIHRKLDFPLIQIGKGSSH